MRTHRLNQCALIVMLCLLPLHFAEVGPGGPWAAPGLWARGKKSRPLEIKALKGPNGNEPVSYKQIFLTEDQKREAMLQKLRIAVLMHTTSDFTTAVIAGVRDSAKMLGGEVVFTSDAGFDANQQKTDIENALLLEPDIIVALILDAVSGGAALRPAIDAGLTITLLSNLPQSSQPSQGSQPFEAGKDYTAIVTDDLLGMGRSAAELIHRELGGKGKVGLMFHDADYYVTNQRDAVVRVVLGNRFPGIKVLTNQGISNPADSEAIAASMLAKYPNLDAIYAPWASIAEGVLAAARSAGREDLKVFTMDLDTTIVLDMAKGGNMSGIVADLPYDLGTTLTNAAVLHRLGAKVPPFITVRVIKVSKRNIQNAWKESLRRELPPEIIEALKEN